MKSSSLFTSESVSEGHPDKLCDQIADAILDFYLKKDNRSHVACEVFATEEYILIGGEITSRYHASNEDIIKIARDVIHGIGYTDPESGIGADTCQIDVRIKRQSPNINDGIGLEGAGDQGIMFGYASMESEGYMPLTITMAHKLVRLATSLRKSGQFPLARPDMKSQVTIDLSDYRNPKLMTMLMSVQHKPGINLDELRNFVKTNIMIPVARSFGFYNNFEMIINPAGAFEIGGPLGDTGLTGRKLIVDTYGCSAHHGGGSFSGKDPSKVDRSAAYYARYIAKNLVAAGAASAIEIQLCYGIGMSKPIAVSFKTFGTKHVSDSIIFEAINRFFDASPKNIIESLGLLSGNFKYTDTCNYGAFGRPDLDLPWEKLDKVDLLKEFFAHKAFANPLPNS